MGIITFLKKRYEEHLIVKLEELKIRSNFYRKSIAEYDETIELMRKNNKPDAASLYSSNCEFSCYTRDLTWIYDCYSYCIFLNEKTEAKIIKLETKLERLAISS